MVRGFVFLKDKVEEKKTFKDILKYIKKSNKYKVWIDLEDPTEDEIDTLVDKFDFHPLSIEDAMIPQDNPKIEEFSNYVFLIIYSFKLRQGKEVEESQLNIFFGENYVITIHEEKIKAIDTLCVNVKNKKKNFFYRGPDIIVHSILDSVVDSYYPIIDKIEDKLEKLEDDILSDKYNYKDENAMDEIMDYKRSILTLRKIINLEKSVVNKLVLAEVDYIKKSIRVYFRDVYDHLSEMASTLDNLRDLVPSLMEGYNNMITKRLNESIHRLTIIATIAVPLTLITSYYGMNVYLPETHWGVWGYFFVLFLLVISAVITYIFIKRKL